MLPPPPPVLSQPTRVDWSEARKRVKAACLRAGIPYPLRAPTVLVEKAARRLTLSSQGKVLLVYRVGLGASPELDKEREGDHRTPEGHFYLCSRNAASAFHLFLGISYPGPEAAARGIRNGRITEAQQRSILRAWNARTTPSQFTALGGLVGIHGGGSGSDWTWGCVALDDAAIEEIWVSCPPGTPVEIRK